MLYPIGIQNFEKLRERGYVYIDKTAKIYSLVSNGGYYFLSRPRRFGKSLLVSTMESYFEGRKDLFGGLAMESLEKEWLEYPVLHLDLSGVSYDSKEVLSEVLNRKLSGWEHQYGVSAMSDIPGLRFQDVIDAAYAKTGRQVVILIDEYDKPIIDNLDRPSVQEYNRSVLQGFYSVLEAKDGCIRFGFLTGVTKIGKLSVFSGLNNLRDISLLPQYSDICGISGKDLHKYFEESVKSIAESNSMTEEQCYTKLAEMYDGYHFSKNSEGVYNPFSLLNSLQDMEFNGYWFETGTPTLLVKVMQRTSFDITKLSEEEADSTLLSTVNTVFENPIPLFFSERLSDHHRL